jgi:hypothetical protein
VWADPIGLYFWTVTVLHARYVRAVPWGAGTIDRRAYLVDLDGRGWLPDLERVLVHQETHGHWQLREVDDGYLDSIVFYKVVIEACEPCCRRGPEAQDVRPSDRDACEPPLG